MSAYVRTNEHGQKNLEKIEKRRYGLASWASPSKPQIPLRFIWRWLCGSWGFGVGTLHNTKTPTTDTKSVAGVFLFLISV